MEQVMDSRIDDIFNNNKVNQSQAGAAVALGQKMSAKTGLFAACLGRLFGLAFFGLIAVSMASHAGADESLQQSTFASAGTFTEGQLGYQQRK